MSISTGHDRAVNADRRASEREELFSISEVSAAFGIAISALRYYEEIGLLRATQRRGRVRYYNRDALNALAYLQLWRIDGLMSIDETKAVLASHGLHDRLAIISDCRDEIRSRIAGLQRAESVLTHMLDCKTEDPLSCPVTGAHIRGRVAAALDGTAIDDGFLPAAEEHTDTEQSAPTESDD